MIRLDDVIENKEKKRENKKKQKKKEKYIMKREILGKSGLPMFDSHVEIFAFGMYYRVVSSASSRPAQTNVHPLFYSRANHLLPNPPLPR